MNLYLRCLYIDIFSSWQTKVRNLGNQIVVKEDVSCCQITMYNLLIKTLILIDGMCYLNHNIQREVYNWIKYHIKYGNLFLKSISNWKCYKCNDCRIKLLQKKCMILSPDTARCCIPLATPKANWTSFSEDKDDSLSSSVDRAFLR